jgi:nicotinate-nucleotide adenylyltransferase
MKTGIFGGTFNPPHVGHLIAAEHVCEQLGLAKILFVPAAVPPHKKSPDLVDGHHRLEMLRHAVQRNRRFEISDLEVRRGGVSYTVDTLRELSTEHAGETLGFILGMDMLSDFSMWRSPDEILELAEIVALTRPDFPMPHLEPRLRKRITVCRIPEIGISSSEIRRRVKEGKSIRYMVMPAVEEYIRMHGLYR